MNDEKPGQPGTENWGCPGCCPGCGAPPELHAACAHANCDARLLTAIANTRMAPEHDHLNELLMTIIPPEGMEIEDEARRQVRDLLDRPAVLSVVGLPDLHPGKGGPVGAAIHASAPIPVLVGNDIGCGFSVFRLGLKAKRLTDPEWIATRLDGLDEPLDPDDREQGFEDCDGIIGGGNHFIEVSMVHRATDDSFTEGEAMLLVHSGSRAFGEALYRATVAIHRDQAIVDTAQAEEWYETQNDLVDFASRNRQVVAGRVAEALSAEVTLISDVPHNYVERLPDGSYLHRKGSSPGTRGPVLLAGSRATPSYLVRPKDCSNTLHSLPHGSGRRLSRSAARSTPLPPGMMRRAPKLTPHGQQPLVVCGDDDLLLEERGNAYKDINAVLAATVNAGLVEVMAELHPVVTFKTSEITRERRDRTRSDDAKKRSRDRKAWR